MASTKLLGTIAALPGPVVNTVFLGLNLACIAAIIIAVALFDSAVIAAGVAASIGVALFLCAVALALIVAVTPTPHPHGPGR